MKIWPGQCKVGAHMKRSIEIATVLLMILCLLPFAAPGTRSTVEDSSNESGEKIAEWTIMVYMAADNNLEGAGIEDINEMEMIGSTDELNYIVQVDRAEGYDTSNGDWQGAKRYRMEKDDDTGTIGSPELEDMGEINMGDPATLAEFIIWAYDNYPARHYFLDLWNHGGAFWGVCWDDSEGNGDPITLPELSDGLDEATAHMGREFDMIGFDACLMAQVAVLYQIKDFTAYSVASGFIEPGDGWPYERVFAALDKDPQMTPEDLGSEIVNDYIDSYTDSGSDPSDSPVVSMALFDLAKIVDLAQEINRLCMYLSTENMRHNLRVKTARGTAECYAYPDIPGPFKISRYTLFDLEDMLNILETVVVADSELIAMSSKVRAMAKDMTVEVRTDPYHPRANGLSIYFPNGKDVSYDPEYGELDFAMEGYWDEYLSFFPSLTSSAGNTPPSLTLDVARGQNVDRSNGTFTIKGTVFDLQDRPNVLVSIDDGEWLDAVVEEGGDRLEWYLEWDVGCAEAGNHTIAAKADDGSEETGVIRRRVMLFEDAPDVKDRDRPFPWGTTMLVLAALMFVGAGAYLLKKRK